MQRTLFSLFGSTVWLCSLPTATLAQTAVTKNDDISGAWIVTEQFPDETRVRRLSLQVAGDKISGQSGPIKIEGTIANATITLKALAPDGSVVATITGKAQDGVLKGERDNDGIKAQWTARRPASRAGGPRMHTFTPTEFHRVFSYAIPPAL